MSHLIRRAGRFLFAVGCAASLLLCATAAALWAQSFRYRYTLSHDHAELQASEWVVSHWVVSIESSCISIESGCRGAWPVSAILPGPQEQMFEIKTDPPPSGYQWYLEPASLTGGTLSINRQFIKWEILRFAYAMSTDSTGRSDRRLFIPFYAVVLTGSVLPTLWVRRRRANALARRRAAVGRCARCGYDLRATPGLCPECGTIPAVMHASEERRLAGPSDRPDAGKAYWREWLTCVGIVMASVLTLACVAMVTLTYALPPTADFPPVP